ncbi:MAG TPA: hypothetical protein VK153_02255 [Candidatus Paceibacterota bacterium]|nr:hypothetical protein [Candidatus Paceibacterota bacterium]
MKIIRNLYNFFDKLEDKIRTKLTHFPLVYAFIGSIGIVSIWRGIWHISDSWNMSGWASLIIGVLITMITGLFVSFFIGENIIISGLNKEKRIDEKTEKEIQEERATISEIGEDIKKIEEIISKK